jgi:hypothetical protein
MLAGLILVGFMAQRKRLLDKNTSKPGPYWLPCPRLPRGARF